MISEFFTSLLCLKTRFPLLSLLVTTATVWVTFLLTLTTVQLASRDLLLTAMVTSYPQVLQQ